MFTIFWQVRIGEIGKKDYQNGKKINSKRWNLWRILDFKCLYFLEKYFMIFQNSLIKSLIHKIKKHKNFKNWFTNIDRQNWKENVKKKTKSKLQNLKKNISHIYIFLKELSEISRNRW